MYVTRDMCLGAGAREQREVWVLCSRKWYPEKAGRTMCSHGICTLVQNLFDGHVIVSASTAHDQSALGLTAGAPAAWAALQEVHQALGCHASQTAGTCARWQGLLRMQ
jgi:hypothetical protein